MNAALLSNSPARQWLRVFGDCPPLGYRCREALPERWFRIHSLPNSKRYPSAPSEYAELLRRHNEVSTAILGAGEACLVFAAFFSSAPEPIGAPEPVELGDHALVWQPALSSLVEPDDSSTSMWLHIAAAEVVWLPSRFDATLRAVADDNSAPILFANIARRTAYAPYDGGADLFLPSPTDRDAAKERWRHWLSARADGL